MTFKEGKGNLSDLSEWKMAFDEKKDEYYARLLWKTETDNRLAIFVINKAIYDAAEQFSDLDRLAYLIESNSRMIYRNYKRHGKTYLLFVGCDFSSFNFIWALDKNNDTRYEAEDIVKVG